MNVGQAMELALAQAELAQEAGEVPVGAVVFCGDRCIAAAHNLCEGLHDPTAHAELLAIRQAAAQKGDWRLEDCTLYVTLEPCKMCAGAIENARVGRVVFGAWDEERGHCGSNGSVVGATTCVGGLLEADCASLLKERFAGRRG